MAALANGSPAQGARPRLTAGFIERAISLAVMVGVVLALVWGWLHRTDSPIDPERGFGYALGIIGGTMMLVLLGYPLRKRARPGSRPPGSVGFWFRFHMLLGLLGPLAIMYHSRFSWGALNSAVALGAMIVVATSGLVGRFFYARIHRGYSGSKLELHALRLEMGELLNSLEGLGSLQNVIMKELRAYEQQAVRTGSAFWPSVASALSLGFGTRFAERRLAGRLRGTAGWANGGRVALADYFRAVRRAAEFACYDRLLRLWHLLHLPLFILLVAAALLHIVAVHMY